MRLAVGMALLVAMTLPAAASADGLPLPVEDVGPTGVATADGSYRFVTVGAGPDTLVERIEQDGGEVSDSIRLDGPYTIPAVALDGAPGGLSADGRTLILIRPRTSFPRETTEFVRFDTDDLRHPHRFRLEGDFSFDALSPDGQTMYLINYVSPRDPTEYHVRALDLGRGRLEPGAIVDPNEPDDEMYGYALSRVSSADGRFAYTLYWGAEHPFIHALDTMRGAAACIDLESLRGFDDMYSLGLEQTPSGDGLLVTQKRMPVLVVDTQTYGVAEVPSDEVADAAAQGTTGSEEANGPSPGWIAIAAGTALLAAAALLVTRRRRRAPA